jgi:hypothetical protein
MTPTQGSGVLLDERNAVLYSYPRIATPLRTHSCTRHQHTLVRLT